MASTIFVDFNLMLGISAAALRLGHRFEWRSPLLWGLALTGAFTFEAVNFQTAQAFIEAYRVNGAGLMSVLFPVLVGALFSFPLLVTIRLARRFWVGLLVFGLAFILQCIGGSIAAAGFTLLKPVSVVGEFIRVHPESMVATVNQFVSRVGFPGWVGFLQAWSLALSALPLALIALLDLFPWARRRPILAAPLYGSSLVIVSYLWFRQLPVMRDYATTGWDVMLGAALSATGALVLGMFGLRLAARVMKATASSQPLEPHLSEPSRRGT
jgi:hypothetical protein